MFEAFQTCMLINVLDRPEGGSVVHNVAHFTSIKKISLIVGLFTKKGFSLNE